MCEDLNKTIRNCKKWRQHKLELLYRDLINSTFYGKDDKRKSRRA